MAAVAVALVAAAPLAVGPAGAADTDVQLWSALKWDQRWSERWSTGFKGELRLGDDVTTFELFQVEPSLRYHFGDRLSLGLVYQFNEKPPDDGDEHVVMQEANYAHRRSGFDLSHTAKVAERVITNVPGVVPQLRYVFGARYPLNARFYLAASEEVRVNLRNAGTGPVPGFEQNRLYGGVGVHVDELVRTEIGYLWRYERERAGAAKSDNVIYLQVVLSGADRR